MCAKMFFTLAKSGFCLWWTWYQLLLKTLTEQSAAAIAEKCVLHEIMELWNDLGWNGP